MTAERLDVQTQRRVRGLLPCNMPCSLAVDKCGQALKHFDKTNLLPDKKHLAPCPKQKASKGMSHLCVVSMKNLKNVLAVSRGKRTGKEGQ